MYEFDWSSIPGAIPLLAKGLLVTMEVQKWIGRRRRGADGRKDRA